MDLTIISLKNTESGKKKLPMQFSEPVRADLIKRAVEAIASHERQPYGTDPRAGLKASASVSKRRRKYRGCYGHGISRVPRKVLTRRGTQFNWVGAVAPGTVGGRKAHPPRASRIFDRKINDKERRKAIRSALAATVDKKIILERGHRLPDNYPFLISKDFESISKTKEVKDALSMLGLAEDLDRSGKKKIRAGTGKSRGRKYKKSKGALIVVSGKCNLLNSCKNIPGIDVVEIKKINAKLLAPGSQPGRLALFTDTAIEKMEKEKLFM